MLLIAVGVAPRSRRRIREMIDASMPDTSALQRRLTSDPPRGGFVIQCAGLAAAGAALS